MEKILDITPEQRENHKKFVIKAMVERGNSLEFAIKIAEKVSSPSYKPIYSYSLKNKVKYYLGNIKNLYSSILHKKTSENQ